MNTNLDRYKKDLERLVSLGHKLQNSLIIALKKRKGEKVKEIEGVNEYTFDSNYQGWYTETFQVIKQLLHDRLSEFESIYKSDQKRKTLNYDTYKI